MHVYYYNIAVVQKEKVGYALRSMHTFNYDESCSEMRSRRGLSVSYTFQLRRRMCSLAGSSVGHRCSKRHSVEDSSPIDLNLVRSTFYHLDTCSVHQDRRRSRDFDHAETWRFVPPFYPTRSQCKCNCSTLRSSVFHHCSRLRIGRGSSRTYHSHSCSRFHSRHNSFHQDSTHSQANSTVRPCSSRMGTGRRSQP